MLWEQLLAIFHLILQFGKNPLVQLKKKTFEIINLNQLRLHRDRDLATSLSQGH